MFREIEKKKMKHKQNQNRAPEQKLWNTNIEILRNTKQSKVGLQMEREKTQSPGQRLDSQTGVGADIRCVGVCLFMAETPSSSSRFVLG